MSALSFSRLLRRLSSLILPATLAVSWRPTVDSFTLLPAWRHRVHGTSSGFADLRLSPMTDEGIVPRFPSITVHRAAWLLTRLFFADNITFANSLS